MSSFVSPEYAIGLMREHQIRYWKLKDSDNRSVIGEQKDGELSVEESIEALRRALAEIEGKYVYLELRGKSAKEKAAGGNVSSGNFDLRIKLSEAGQSGIGSIGAMHPMFQALQDQIQQLREENLRQKHAQEILELKRELKEAKEGNPALDAVIAGLGNLFMNQGTPAQPQAAPVPAQPVQAVSGAAGGKIKEALKTIASVDPELPSTLEALARFAKANPDMYAGYVQTLKNSA